MSTDIERMSTDVVYVCMYVNFTIPAYLVFQELEEKELEETEVDI